MVLMMLGVDHTKDITQSLTLASIDALLFEYFDLLLKEVSKVDSVNQKILKLLLTLGLHSISLLQLLQFVCVLQGTLHINSPVFVLLRCLFEVFVHGIELIQ